ncbi:CidA/LrgA family protein [Zunongwangia sp. SCSIO 43204]|uniref:CidA/LrgA family protein n=1 Tax=Zunongwangia sp. SCSIO 43204 TaxID=2779359 RepID=UPI001CA88F0B|nr:CidA/LrgA family protein [Zunongwangia sp. SCSIO 43204]UAB85647.1 CidA/LrgA family protein [Zunongwangia sp. SCSIO 43204]
MIKSLIYIFCFLFLGELIHYFFNIPIAGNIIGMLLIFLALFFKMIKLEDVKPASDFLVKYLVVFFIPYGVGLMVYANIIAAYWIPVSVAVILSTLLSLYATGAIYQKLDKK